MERLLRVRQTHEISMKRDLEGATQKLKLSQEKEKTLQNQIQQLDEEMQKGRLEGRMKLHDTYAQILAHLNEALAQVQNALTAQNKIIEEQKERLKQAVQERKLIEKIKEKHYASWASDTEREEGASNDEFALKGHTSRFK